MVSARLDKLVVSSWEDDTGLAPPSLRWNACLRDYDEGAHVSSGPTQRKAIDELLDYYEQDSGELRE
jgi:hypothetical protein